MNLVRKPDHASSNPSIEALIEQRHSLKGRTCRHVQTFQRYQVHDVGLGGCELQAILVDKTGKQTAARGRLSHHTWEQFARTYNLVDEDRGDAV